MNTVKRGFYSVCLMLILSVIILFNGCDAAKKSFPVLENASTADIFIESTFAESTASTTPAVSTTSAAPTTPAAATTSTASTPPVVSTTSTTSAPPVVSTTSAPPAETTNIPSEQTPSQKNALKRATLYLSLSYYSREGLIAQLRFENISYEDCVYAVDNCGADWNEQAAAKARFYLSYVSLSRELLIYQLMIEKFTYEQALYAAVANGL